MKKLVNGKLVSVEPKFQKHRIARCRLLIGTKCNYTSCKDRYTCYTMDVSKEDLAIGNLSSYAFTVINNKKGQQFIKQLKENLNKDHLTMTVRGRGINRKSKGGNQNGIPLKSADWFAIYLTYKPIKDKLKHE